MFKVVSRGYVPLTLTYLARVHSNDYHQRLEGSWFEGLGLLSFSDTVIGF